MTDAYELMRQRIRKPLKPYIKRQDFIDICEAIQDYMLTSTVTYDTMSIWIYWKTLIEQQQHLSDKEVQ